jgi:DNA-directed RNA polymerase subunit RPC12/RpoP
MMIPRPVCLTCGVQMNVMKNGVRLFDLTGTIPGHSSPPVPSSEILPKVRAVWSTDVYQCPRCKFRVAAGFGAAPIAEDFQPERIMEYLNDTSQKFFFVGGS